MANPSKFAYSSKSSVLKNKLRSNAPRPHTRFPSILNRRNGKITANPPQVRQSPQHLLPPQTRRRRCERPMMLWQVPGSQLFKRQSLLNLSLHLVYQLESVITNGAVWKNPNHRHGTMPSTSLPQRSRPGIILEKRLKHMRIGSASFNAIYMINHRMNFLRLM